MKRVSLSMLLIGTAFLVTSLFNSPTNANRKSQGKETEQALKKRGRDRKIQARDSGQEPKRRQSSEAPERGKGENKDSEDEEQDADLPPDLKGFDRETYFRLREQHISRLRGVEPGRPIDPSLRGRAIAQMERQEARLHELRRNTLRPNAVADTWISIGPKSLPNGSAQGGSSIPVTGRVTAIVVDPSNSNTIYLGTAQGGVWRSLDGGTTWASIFDSAQSLAIGALALAPSNPTILYVGTGEYNGCGDCFFGAGLYRVENANTSATLVGPINPSTTIGNLTYNVFQGRSIARIVVHPSDPATIFVATGSGVSGSGNNSLGLVPGIATRGVYRSTNATMAAGSVTFQKLVVTTDNSPDSPATGNVSTPDLVLEPGAPNNLLVSVIGVAASGGIFRSTNALAATPVFTQTLTLPPGIRAGLAINTVGPIVTVYAATGETPVTPATCTTPSGALRKSVDGGVTWSSQLPGGGGFCGGQCFYNITVAVDPNDANIVYLGGNARGSCSDAMKKSIDGGANFQRDDNGLHADSHALFFDLTTSPSTIYTGNDGGVWKRASTAAAGTAWINLNNSPLDTLQFESLAVHPTDRNLTIGGTQDNGTELQQSTSGSWVNSRGGDGGVTLIDQSATDTTNVNMYHTFFFSSGSQIRYERVTTVAAAAIGNWVNIGCAGGTPANGITCTDNTLFYAPMALGPGTPNTVYVGSDRLYRSSDRGNNHTVESQAPIAGGVPVSAIGISRQDDNYRIVGLQNGQVWATSAGSSTLLNITSGGFPANPNGSSNRFVGRAVIDPNNKDVAYVTFSFYAPAGSGVWKITNFGAAAGATPATPNWIAAGNGIPSVPINAFVVDPQNSNNLYAGTDIGVYFSQDGGANWNPYGTGLPRVAVFDMAIQPTNSLLRIATHGRGMWEIPTAQTATTIQLSASNYNVGEGGVAATVSITRTGDTSGASTVDFASSDGAATQAQDYVVSSGTLNFAAGDTSKSFNVLIVDDGNIESDETFNVILTNPVGAVLGSPATATVTINDNDTAGSITPAPKRFAGALDGAQETPANNSAAKGTGLVLLNGPETSAQVGMIFQNLGSPETVAHIHGPSAPGVAAPIIFPLPSTNPVINFVISPTAQQVADLKASLHYLNVHSNNFPNGEIRGQLRWNPTLEESFFVRQQYLDFLSRDGDPGGFAFWVNQVGSCVSDAQCFHDRTISTSDAFFFEPEFQQTAGYVFRAYRAAFGNNQPFPNPDGSNPAEANKLINYPTFVADRARVVGGANLVQAQQDFANLFVTRSAFTTKYAGATTAATFVDAILATIQAADAVDLSSQRQTLIDQYNNAGGGNAGRAMVLYRLADDNAQSPITNLAFINAEYNRQFALTLYFGYLRRNPDIGGFLFWQGQINLAPVRDVPKQNALVCSFITAAEYQGRFGTNAPRTNAECPQ